MAFANTQNLVPTEEIKENTVVLHGGRLLQILMVDGLNFSLKSEEEQNVITATYQNFINALDYPIQVVVHSRKINIKNYLDGLKEYENKETSPLLQNQIAEYREFVRAFVKDNPIMTKTFLVVVPFAPITIPKKESFFKIFPFVKRKSKEEAERTTKEAHESSFRKNLAQLEQRVNQVTDGLNAIGLEAMKLNDDALIELFYNFYNPEAVEREDITPHETIAKEAE